MVKLDFKVSSVIWEDKNVPGEAKYIYAYIFTKGIGRYIVDINIGELQQTLKIKNKGLKRNLEILSKLKYLIYEEYANGMYTIKLA